MYKNILITGTGKFVPNNKVYNDYFVEHFDKLGMKSQGLMEHLGRRKRYLATENDTSLSMGYEAAKDVLANTATFPKELDMIIFVSDTPEYLMPTNAIKIIDMIGATKTIVGFDMNSNCTGLLTALDIAASYMMYKPNIKKTMIVGSFLISTFAKDTDTVVYSNFADSAVALMLEATEEETPRGLLDSETYIDSSYHLKVALPECGFSKMGRDDMDINVKKVKWDPFDFGFLSDKWAELIKKILHRHNITAQDIDYFVFSQLSDPDNMSTLEKLGVGEEKYFFLGKEYGYTGLTCPGLVLNRMWHVIAKKGNKIIFCSVGAGYSIIAQLYEF